ncbi:hypothetical protein K3169_11545 [Pseudomonas phytophila]|uniref:Uncharacterized protein n=1 Tax=Pseudomonas phytophila TaxID=2867264 RepID=A0ABY6FLG5_9PSED|nr:hypothetical protein [Pseudomonas phytophila]UXZ98448.1 hypothetical protein K3169_11545 [Pseudomonas phytophila]
MHAMQAMGFIRKTALSFIAGKRAQESIPDQVIALGFISALCVPDTALSQSKPGSMWEPGLPAMQAMGCIRETAIAAFGSAYKCCVCLRHMNSDIQAEQPSP